MSKRDSLSIKLRFEVLKRDHFTCAYCGAHPPNVQLRVDHVWPVAKGGPTTLGNLVTSCFECNAGKRDFPLREIAPPKAEPAEDAGLDEKIGYFVSFVASKYSDVAVEQAAFIAGTLMGEHGLPLRGLISLATKWAQWRDLVWVTGITVGTLAERRQSADVPTSPSESELSPERVQKLFSEQFELHHGRPPLPWELESELSRLASWVETDECRELMREQFAEREPQP